MERKRFTRVALNTLWAVLILTVLLLFFKDRLTGLPGLIKKIRKEPEAIVAGFKPRDMTGFRCDFREPADLELWKTSRVRLQPVSSLFGADDIWARATYYPSDSPGLLWTEDTIGVMDWRGAERFSVSVYNPQAWAVDLKIKIKDVSGNAYQKSFVLPSGRVTRIDLPTEEIAARLDLSHVGYLNLFLWTPATETVLYYSDLVLSGPGRPSPATALVRFMGLQFPSAVRRGDTVEGAFYFILHKKLSGDHTLLLRLRQGEELHTLARIDPPFPTSKWRVERLAKVGPVPVTIPGELAAGTYQLEVALAQPVPTDTGLTYVFQPYDNPGIEGFAVSEITVTDGDDK